MDAIAREDRGRGAGSSRGGGAASAGKSRPGAIALANLSSPGFYGIRRRDGAMGTGKAPWVAAVVPWGPECDRTVNPRSLRPPHPWAPHGASRSPSIALDRRAPSRNRDGCCGTHHADARFVDATVSIVGGPDARRRRARAPVSTRDRTTPRSAPTLSRGAVSAPCSMTQPWTATGPPAPLRCDARLDVPSAVAVGSSRSSLLRESRHQSTRSWLMEVKTRNRQIRRNQLRGTTTQLEVYAKIAMCETWSDRA